MKKTLLVAMALLLTLTVSAQGDCKKEKACCKKEAAPAVVLRIDDMHCQKCANRIKERLQQKVAGVDSLLPDFGQHTLEIRYDAARTNKDEICSVVTKAGYTPVVACRCGKGAYAYFLIPKEATTQETLDKVLAIKGVKDANTATVRRSLSVVYNPEELTADQLLAAVKAAGIEAALPKPHVCNEEKKSDQ